MDVGIRGCRYGSGALWRQPFRGAGGTERSDLFGALLKAQDSGGGLASVYGRLSPASQNALEALRAGRGGMSKQQWNTLCRELKDLGVITQAQFDYSRADFRLAPLVSDGRGGVTAPTIVKEFLGEGKFDRWDGDPLAYLEEWIEALRESRSALCAEYWPDGERKYEDLSPFTRQIDECGKVAGILRELLAL